MGGSLERTEQARILFSRKVLSVTAEEKASIEHREERFLSEANFALYFAAFAVSVPPLSLAVLGKLLEARMIGAGLAIAVVALLFLGPAVVHVVKTIFAFVWSVNEMKKMKRGEVASAKGLRMRPPVAVLTPGAVVYSLVRPIRYERIGLAAAAFIVGHVSVALLPTIFANLFDWFTGLIVLDVLFLSIVAARVWASWIDRTERRS